VFVLAFIWFAVIAAIVSFRVGKWVPTIGAFVRIAVLGFFTISVVIYAIKNGVHGTFGGGKFLPSYAVFIAAVPVLFFNYVGFELPSAAGEEMKNPQRDVPFSVIRSAGGAVLLYGIPILSILLLLPAKQVTGLGGFLDAIKSVFTVYGGHIAANGTPVLTGAGQVLGYLMAIAFILALLTSGTTWIMGADRAQAVAALDGAAPRILGLLCKVRHADRGELAFGHRRHGGHGAGLHDHGRQRAEVLHGRARAGDLDDDHLVHRDLPGDHQAQVQPPARPAALSGAGRQGDALGRRRPLHAVGDPRERGAHLPGLRHGQPR
jgi:hypothetical protein